jgi:tetratricopeptide (TPR) repeat protein
MNCSVYLTNLLSALFLAAVFFCLFLHPLFLKPALASKQTQSSSALLAALRKHQMDDDRYAIRFISEARHPALSNNARVLSHFSINYAKARWMGEALDLSEKALKLAPKDDYVLSSRAWVLTKNKNSNVAVVPAKMAVSLKPDARNLAILAEVFQARGDLAQADDALAKARHADQNSFDTTAASARILIARMKGPEALVEVSKYVKLHPNDLRGLILHSEVAEIVGQRKQCIADLTTVLKAQPKHGYALQKRAEAFQKEKEFVLASADIRRLLSLDSDVGIKIVANKTLSECQESLGNMKEAYKARAATVALANTIYKSDLTTAVKTLPSDFSKDMVDCCRLEIALKRYESALSKLNIVLLNRPNYTHAREQHAYALEGLSRWNEALADWSRLITKQPTYPKWYENRARVYKKLGNESAAHLDLETLKKLLQDSEGT